MSNSYIVPARRRRNAMTMIELLVVMAMILLLSGTLYQILRNVQKSFTHARNKLDILQTTRIIMSGIRNELRNAIDKPEASLLDNANIMNIPLSKTETIVYHFDKATRRLFRGKKGNIREPDPDPADMRPFMFDDGQILKFEFDNSYRNSDSFVESELALNSKVWFKVSMTILYTDKFALLSEAEKQKILNDPTDPRVKNFFMMITPRRVNWLLQATQ
ncbi:MAG TPA: type II secretion system protein [Candidatus Ozemobacteraceae bacterium]|nr:type II secretion system protein [Candidatus Ozemobacteraceae bacterium]